MRGRSTLIRGLVLAALAAGALALVVAARRQGAPRRAGAPAEPRAAQEPGAAMPAEAPPPVLWQVPPFSFADQHGRPAAAADLRGHVWIADFIFTRCTTICPLITAKMALLQ